MILNALLPLSKHLLPWEKCVKFKHEMPNTHTVAERKPEERVVGGAPCEEHQYPWLATLNCNSGWFCTCALIGPQTVLTAAHCVDGCSGGFTITVGEHDRNDPNDHVTAIQVRVARWSRPKLFLIMFLTEASPPSVY